MKLVSHVGVRMEHMNHHGSLEAEYLADWMIGAAYIGVVQVLGRKEHIVMCAVKDLRFHNPVLLGAILSIRYELVRAGTTSLTIAVEARDMLDPELLYGSCQVVFVNTDDNGKSTPHGITMAKEQEDQPAASQ